MPAVSKKPGRQRPQEEALFGVTACPFPTKSRIET